MFAPWHVDSWGDRTRRPIGLAHPGYIAEQAGVSGLGRKDLVLLAGLADGSVVAMARIDGRVVGQYQKLFGDAIYDLLKSFGAAGFTGPAGEKSITRE